MFKRWLKDTAERTLATYCEVFLGLLIATWVTDTSQLDLSFVAVAGWSAIPAALTVLKAAFADLRAGTVSPASLVK